MAISTTYSSARANLARLLDKVTDDREVVIIKRRNGADVAVIALDELEGILETSHLLRSPKNARRLLQALERARRGTTESTSLVSLADEVGLGDAR